MASRSQQAEGKTYATNDTLTFIIGLSGPSSSGKTTLARLLRPIFNVNEADCRRGRSMKLFILHEDDFYKQDREIPYVTTISGREVQDWDCAEAVDLPLLESTLQYIHSHGCLPPDMISKEDQNTVGESGVSGAQVQDYQQAVQSWLSHLSLPSSTTRLALCIVDGFLLYSDPARPRFPPSITSLLDIKLFIRSDYARTKRRREARKGYVTLEGFWEDPEGYVDEIVWPNYVKQHAWIFEDGEVDQGEVRDMARRQKLLFAPGTGERSMAEILEWGVSTIKDQISNFPLT